MSSAAMGLANRYPCPRGHDSPTRNSRCSSESMPSASGTIPRLCPSWMIARAMVAASESPGSLRTNDWSTLRMSTGRSFSRRIEERAFPKSSMAIFKPASRNCCRTRPVRSGSAIAAVSGTSMTMVSGSTRADRRVEVIRSTRLGCHSCLGDRLMLMSSSSPSSRQVLDWRHISSTTQSPTASIRPMSSAARMNSPGGTRSPLESLQRRSASTPTMSLPSRSTIGW